MTRLDYLGHSEEPQEEIHARPALHPDYRPFDFLYVPSERKAPADLSGLAENNTEQKPDGPTEKDLAWLQHDI